MLQTTVAKHQPPTDSRVAKSKPLVVCIGSFVTKNFGDQAIFQSIKENLTRHLDIYVDSFPIKAVQVTHKTRRMNWLQKALSGLTWLPSHYVYLWKTVRKANVVCIGGGQLIHDRFPLTIVQLFFTCLAIHFASRQFLVVTIGAGPIRRRWARVLTGLACSMSAGVIARDSYSHSILKSCFRSTRWLRSHVVPDPVFVLKGSALQEMRAIHSPIRVGVSIIFQMKPGDYRGGIAAKYQQYLSRMEQLVRLLIEKMGADVVLFSTVPWEDTETVDELLSRFEGNDRVKGAKIDSVEDSVEVTGSLDFLVSTRLHSLIFALAQGVPTVALSNQEKIIGLYLDLDASDLQFDINNFNPEDVVAAVERLSQGRGQQLLRKVRQHQAKASQGLREIAAEIGTKCRVTLQ